MKVITDSINEIIRWYEKKENLSVREIKILMSRFARKHKLGSIPWLVDLVSAVP